MDKSRPLHRTLGRLKIFPPKEDVHILGVSHCRFIDARHPKHHRIPTRDRIRNFRRFQRGRRAKSRCFTRSGAFNIRSSENGP